MVELDLSGLDRDRFDPPDGVRPVSLPGAVLSGVDSGGWAARVRFRPRYDRARAVLRCDRAPGVDIVDRPASLLWYDRDAQPARLRS